MLWEWRKEKTQAFHVQVLGWTHLVIHFRLLFFFGLLHFTGDIFSLSK